MSQSLHVCKICGKWFATAQAVRGHQRVHSELKRVWDLKKPPRVCSVSTSIESKALDPSLSLKDSSSVMSEIEKHEMDEAAMSLVMLSERVSVLRNLPPCDVAMDVEKVIHCVDQSKQEVSEVSATCGDVVAQALPSPLVKRETNFSYRFKICGKRFERSLGAHQALHRSNREQLECKKEAVEVINSLCDVLADSGAKKIVPQPSLCLEVSQEELVERGDTNVKEHSGESRQGLSKVSSHSGFEKSSSYSDVVAQEALPFPLRIKLQEEAPESNSSYKCKVCGKTFRCFQALGGHQTLHRSSNRGKPACEKEGFEAGHSLSLLTVSGAKKAVPEPSCSEVLQEELIKRRDANLKEQCIDSRQDVVAQALPFPVRKKFQEKPQSKSSYKCKVCGETFRCFQALGGHQNLHRPVGVILGRKRKRFEDSNSPSGSSEAKEIAPQPSSFEVSQEELIERRDTNVKEHCVVLKQDFEKFSTCSDVLAQALPSPLRCNMEKGLQSNSSYERVLKML